MNFIRFKKSKWWLLNILPLILFFFFIFYSFKSREIMTWLYTHTSYYLVFALCIIWIFQLLRLLSKSNFSLAKFVKSYWLGSSLALILTITVFISVPVKLKIFNDETNLLAVSQSMLYQKQAYRISMAKYYYGELSGNVYIFNRNVCSRPKINRYIFCHCCNVFDFSAAVDPYLWDLRRIRSFFDVLFCPCPACPLWISEITELRKFCISLGQFVDVCQHSI